jgi:hypothetical protein
MEFFELYIKRFIIKNIIINNKCWYCFCLFFYWVKIFCLVRNFKLMKSIKRLLLICIYFIKIFFKVRFIKINIRRRYYNILKLVKCRRFFFEDPILKWVLILLKRNKWRLRLLKRVNFFRGIFNVFIKFFFFFN